MRRIIYRESDGMIMSVDTDAAPGDGQQAVEVDFSQQWDPGTLKYDAATGTVMPYGPSQLSLAVSHAINQYMDLDEHVQIDAIAFPAWVATSFSDLIADLLLGLYFVATDTTLTSAQRLAFAQAAALGPADVGMDAQAWLHAMVAMPAWSSPGPGPPAATADPATGARWNLADVAANSANYWPSGGVATGIDLLDGDWIQAL